MPGLKITPDNYTDYVTTGNPGSLSDLASSDANNPLKKVFFIYNVGTKKFLTQGGYWGTHAALSDTPHPFWLQAETENKCEQYLTFPGKSGETKELIGAEPITTLLYSQPSIYVGSQEGKGRSCATYKSITYTQTVDGETKETNLIGNGTITASPNGNVFTSDAISNAFANNGTITAVLDLSTCKEPSEHYNKAENILSIGTNIDKWGKGDVTINGVTKQSGYNLHIYYYKSSYDNRSQNPNHYNLEIEYVDKDWSDSRRTYAPVTGDYLRITLSSNGLYITTKDTDGKEATQSFFVRNNVRANYAEGMENRIAYFPTNTDGTYKIDSDGYITADPNITAPTDNYKPYSYTDVIKADGTASNQKLFLSPLIVKNDGSYADEGKFLAYSINKGNDNKADYGVYTDRNIATNSNIKADGHNNEIVVKRLSQWTFDYAPSARPENQGKNVFYMKLNMPVNPATNDTNAPTEGTIKTPSDGTWDNEDIDSWFTLDLSDDYVLGNRYSDTELGLRNVYYNFDLYQSEEESRNGTTNPTKEPKGNFSNSFDNFAEYADMVDVYKSADQETAWWKIVSVYDYYTMVDNVKQTAALSQPADLSFTIADNNFLRDNGRLSTWQAEETLKSTLEEIAAGNAKLRIGVDEYYKPSPDAQYYYNSAGKQLTQQDSREYNAELRNHSRYSGVAVTNGGYGKFYQDVKVYSPGWYRVGCKGATNVGAKLFATVTENDNEKGEEATKQLGYINENIAHYMTTTTATEIYWPFDINHPIYNTVALMTDPFVKSYHKMADTNCFLWVKVNRASTEYPATLRIGIDVPQENNAATQAETSQKGININKWTVADDFKLYFGGNEESNNGECLVLDEENTDLKYLDKCQYQYTNTTLRLNRNFKLRQWNSFILPVGLTQEQFKATFGEDAMLAKLDHLTKTQIVFQKVKEDKNGFWLEPNTPYIIYPTKAGDKAPHKIELKNWDSSTTQITVPEGHYAVSGVTLDRSGSWATTEGDVTHWNFDNGINTTVKTAGPTDKYEMDSKYVIAADKEASGNGTMRAYGLLAANYTTEGDKKLSISNIFPLKETFVISNTKMVHVGEKGTASKGFRCFFSYNNGNNTGTSSIAPQLLLSGFDGTATAIDGIADNDTPTATGRWNNAVYSIDGQMVRKGTSTDGLDSGLYIVGGRKVIIK